MCQADDNSQRVKDDLLRWIDQNQGLGQDWFFDEGPVAAGDLTTETAVAPSTAEPKPGPAPEITDPVFRQECQAFVDGTLAAMTPGAQVNGSTPANPEQELDDLRREVQSCQKCALASTRTQVVFGAGSARARVLFIGEAPGRDEDLQGEPFVGASGQLLTKIIGAIGFDRRHIFICNILKCRPPGNRDPLPAEVEACEAYLQRQLEIIQPRVICCLGRVAAQTLLGTDQSLGKLRGKAHFYRGIPVMATYHPAALLRNPSWKRATWQDVQKLRALHDALERESS